MRRFFIFMIVGLLVLTGCKSKKAVAIAPTGQESAKEMYETSRKYMKKDPDRARLLFKEVMQLFPESVYARLAKIGVADSYFNEKHAAAYVMAAAEYQEYVNLYPNAPDAPYSRHQVGMCYFKQMKKPGRDQTNTLASLTQFEALVQQFPGSDEAADAKEQIIKIREYLAAHYFSIGLANFKLKAFKGAINRFKQVIDDYPEYSRNDRTFYYAGRTYFAMKEYESAISFFQRVINSYPKSKTIKSAQKMIVKINKLQTVARGDQK